MTHLIRWFAGLCLSLLVAVPLALAVEVSEADVKKAIQAFETKDPSIKTHFKSAHGYAVFPDIGKTGVIVGGSGGDAAVYERGKRIGSAEVSQLSIGAQVGIQHYRQVIFFQDKAALDRFRANKLEFDANASAVIAKSGASSGASYRKGVLVVTSPISGAMLEAAVGGQKFTFQPMMKKK
jgi:lipid-binding SYLF domain-containing protein